MLIKVSGTNITSIFSKHLCIKFQSVYFGVNLSPQKINFFFLGKNYENDEERNFNVKKSIARLIRN